MLGTRALAAIQRRTFVSTVLLTRNWENESVNVLKREAKKRGLLQTGNKSTLVSRLNEHELQQVVSTHPTPSPMAQQQVRLASTTEVPGIPSTSKASPLPPNYPKQILDVKIPDISQPTFVDSVDVPFLPDFWDSSKVKAESAPPAPAEPTTPKVLAVAGAATHIGGGPSHNLYSPSSAAGSESGTSSTSEPPADSKETDGAWTLVGLIAGSWLVAGLLKPQSAFAKKEEASVAEQPSH